MEIRADGDRRTLLLHDLHAEYTGTFGDNNSNFAETKPANSTIWGDCELYWSSYGVADALTEIFGYEGDTGHDQMLRVMREFFPPEFIEREGGYEAINYVWRLTGNRDFLEMKFNQLAQALDVDYVSGDDDAFDYWPNTMDMLFDFALDLDAIDKTEAHRELATTIARRVLAGTVQRGTTEREVFISEWGSRGWTPPEWGA